MFEVELSEEQRGVIVKEVGVTCKPNKDLLQCKITDKETGETLAEFKILPMGGSIEIYSKDGEIAVENLAKIRTSEVRRPIRADFEW